MSGRSDTFAEDLAAARARKVPVMALRPDHQFPDELDDIVIQDVKMFRAEAMSERSWWMACYFANGEEISFVIHRDTKPARIAVSVTEYPPEWIDWDKHPEARR